MSTTSEPEKTPLAVPAKRRRIGRAIIGFGLSILLVLLVAPYLIAQTSLRNSLLGLAFHRIDGTVTAGRATLGWFSPIEFHDLEVRPRHGAPLLTIKSFRGDLPLWRLLLLHDDLGRFRCEQPMANVVITPGGSNFKQVFAGQAKSEPEQPEPPENGLSGVPRVAVALQVVDASVSLSRVDSDELPTSTVKDAGAWIARGMNLSAGLTRAVDDPDKSVLFVDPGMFIARAQLTQDVCHAWLKYLAPMLAGSTNTEGSFSIDLDQWRIPLDDPRLARLGGRFIIHSLDTLPGPVGQAITGFLNLPSAIITADDSVVAFDMHDGRIHHRDLKFVLSGLPVETSGSVGVDQTLDVVAKVTLPQFSNQEAPLRRALSGRVLEIPIGGTLAKPEVKPEALTREGVDILSDLLGNLAAKRRTDGTAETLPAPNPLDPTAPAGTADGAAVNWEEALQNAIPLVEDALRNRRQRRREQQEQDRAAQGNDPIAPQDPMPDEFPKRPTRIRRGVRRLLDGLGPPQESSAPSPTESLPTPTPAAP